MAPETQQVFMDRIRRALTDRGPRVDLPEDIEVARVVGKDQDTAAFFIQRVGQAAMQPHRVTGELLDASDPEACFTADLGITGVELAVAETASMSVKSGGGRRRLASLAVPCHIAIVPTARIVPDLLDWGYQADSDPPANEVLISGPSKTADIEGTIVQGVHGPGTVHVVVVD
jgi:L-lactate utilization protein LutC